MPLVAYEQQHQIKLYELEWEEFAVLQQWNIPVANPATEILSNSFSPDEAPCASLHHALPCTHAFLFQGLYN